MEKFLFRLALFLSTQAIVLVPLSIAYVATHKQGVEQGMMAATIDKHQLLQQQGAPRIIFVGGSSFAFGHVSPMVKQSLPDYNPINMGLHAGVGGSFMLNEVKSSLKSGDVVVVSLEYENFIDFPPGPKEVADVVEARWQNAQFVPVDYLPRMLDRGMILIGGVLRRTVAGLSGEIEREPFYARSGLNSFGDVTAHYQVPDDVEKLSREERTYTFQPENVQKVIQELNQFYEFCKARNVRVFYAQPPLMKRVQQANQADIQALETTLKQALQFPMLDRASEVAYADNLYFDTRYHLNYKGAQIRTQHLINRLSPYLTHENADRRSPKNSN